MKTEGKNYNTVMLGDIIAPAKLRRAGKGDYPILSMTMHNGLVDQADKFKKRIASKDTSPYKVVQAKQLVVGFPINEGVLAFQELYPEAIVSPAYDVWNLKNPEQIETVYLQRFLRSPIALSYYSSRLRGTTARRRTLPDDVFLQLPVFLPPLGEQRRLASILDSADQVRRLRAQTLEKLDELVAALFLDSFGDPANSVWPKVKLGHFSRDVVSGFASGKNEETGIAQVRMNNITRQGTFDFSQIRRVPTPKNVKRVLLNPGDIMFNSTNSPSLVGKSALFTSFPEPLTFSNHFLRLRFSEELQPRYAAHWLVLQFKQGKFERLCTQWVNQATVRREDLLNLQIPLPPLPLQQQFAARVEAIEAVKARAREALVESDALFLSLQERAFAGAL